MVWAANRLRIEWIFAHLALNHFEQSAKKLVQEFLTEYQTMLTANCQNLKKLPAAERLNKFSCSLFSFSVVIKNRNILPPVITT
jgi:hypothetical protein